MRIHIFVNKQSIYNHLKKKFSSYEVSPFTSEETAIQQSIAVYQADAAIVEVDLPYREEIQLILNNFEIPIIEFEDDFDEVIRAVKALDPNPPEEVKDDLDVFESVISNEKKGVLQQVKALWAKSKQESNKRSSKKERKVADEADRQAAEEVARQEAERQAAEEAARQEAERQAAEEAARQEAERQAAEEAARQEAERQAAEEAARQEAERQAAEEAARQEAERQAVEEAARQEAERQAAEEAARQEAERQAAEEAARQEAERQAAEEAARQEAERQAAEEAARQEAERQAAEEAARQEAERQAAEEAARQEAERQAAEEAARQEAERQAAEEAARQEASKWQQFIQATRQEAEREANGEAERHDAIDASLEVAASEMNTSFNITKTDRRLGSVTIAIGGYGRRTGASHTSIQLAAYLKTKKEKVACVEVRSVNTSYKYFVTEGTPTQNGGYHLNGVTYYPNWSLDRLPEVYAGGFSFVILDCGGIAEGNAVVANDLLGEFFKAEHTIITTCSSVWDKANLLQLFAVFQQMGWQKSIDIIVQANDRDAYTSVADLIDPKEKKERNIKVYCNPISASPFDVPEESSKMFDELMKVYFRKEERNFVFSFLNRKR
ncbi:hypothetical protein [Paenibacillus alvei]|uniref:hypothetical protein n=1 Tax=Paenibacillus alvei TaxID=44250 RepID=UPI002280B85B|nr:hypothetical protein [Paenibacillus alvei]